MWFLHKLKIELLYDVAIALRYFVKNTKILILRDLCTPMFIAALFTIVKVWKQPKRTLIDKRIKKCGIEERWAGGWVK